MKSDLETRREKNISRMQRYRWLIAGSHHVTWFLGKHFPGLAPLQFVTGFPKSGTVWVTQLLADYLQLPFPAVSALPIGCPAVVHGHQPVSKKLHSGAYVMRDGRDAMVSLYFHLAKHIPAGDRPRLTAAQRRMFPGLVNKEDIRTNLPPFLEVHLKRPRFTHGLNWAQHVATYVSGSAPNFSLIRYERLLAEPENELATAVETITSHPADGERIAATIYKFDFQRQTARRPGEEDRSKFLRSGKTGDWRNHFTPQAAEIFDDYCGEMLVEMGYEQDRCWRNTLLRAA